MAIATPNMIGQPIKRREDPRLITGSATYVDDIQLPGMVHLAIVRGPYGHARIKNIDTEAAAGAAGVHAIVTAKDLEGATTGPLPGAVDLSPFEELKEPERYPLATDKVRYVGDPVAAVVADGAYAAADAAGLVEVDYEPLPAAVDPEEALAGGASLLFEEFGTNLAHRQVREAGDVEAAFRQADRVVELRILNQRVLPTALETRGCVADWQPGTAGESGALTLWSSTQIPHSIRTKLSKLLGLPENRVRVIAPEVGGGFGNKIDVSPEETLSTVLAMRLARPVKWVEDRRENFQAAMHGRGQLDIIEAAVMNDGRVTAIRVRAICDLGAYYQYVTPEMGTLTGRMLPGNYDIRNIRFELIGAFTNKTPVGAYRGAGRPEATYLLECLMDKVAQELGQDPADVRRINFIKKEAFPHTTAFGTDYDTGDYEMALDRALQLAGYGQLRDEQRARRARGELMGVGLAAYVEICGFGPWESATVRVEPSGQVTAYTGTSPHGQGSETAMAQIVAEQLGLALEDVVVLHSDTATTQTGQGTYGSRSAVVGGTAMLLAVDQVKAKAVRVAAGLLEASAEDVALEDGRFAVRGAPDRSLILPDVAQAAYDGDVPDGDEPGLEATRFFKPDSETYPFGVHIAVVDVDSETGRVSLRRFIAVDDCGRVINPLLVDGQRHGGIAQGAGQALFEEATYDEQGQLMSGSLNDYALPTAHDFPMFELDRTETPSPRNPLGVKGIGEAGTIGSTPAVRNAVLDALRPLGVTDLDMPASPQRVWRLISARRDVTA